MHQAIYFQWGLIAFLAAVGITSFFIIPAWVVWLLIIGAALCFTQGTRPVCIVAGVVALALAGGIYRYHAARTNDTPLYQLAVAKADVTITGYIDGDAKHGAKDWSVYVMAKTVEGNPVSERLLIRVATEPKEKYGDGVELSGRIGRVSAFDGFDYPAYLRAHGVRAMMIHPQVADAVVPLSWSEHAWVWTVRSIWNIRDTFMASVRRAIPEPAASYMIGILVGGRAALPASIVDDFSRTSTSHILAISGYNITILAAAVMAALSAWMGRRRAVWTTVFMVVVFVIMTGAGASIVRAAIMATLMMVGSMLGRQVSIGNVILLSAAAMVAYNPLIVRDDVGFQLSFAALSGLVWLEPLVAGRMGKLAEHPIGKIVASTTAAQIAVLPLILYYFQTLSVVGPLANVLVLPFVPLAMALGFATGLVGLVVPILARLIGVASWMVASYHLGVIHYLASLSWSAFSLMINSQIVIGCYGILAIWWHLEKKSGIKKEL